MILCVTQKSCVRRQSGAESGRGRGPAHAHSLEVTPLVRFIISPLLENMLREPSCLLTNRPPLGSVYEIFLGWGRAGVWASGQSAYLNLRKCGRFLKKGRGMLVSRLLAASGGNPTLLVVRAS